MSSKVLKMAEKETGWVGMVLLGGPNPRMGGELSLKVVCSGKTPAGNDFQDSFANFDDIIVTGFQDFLRAVFPAETRAEWALNVDGPASNVIQEDLAPVADLQPPPAAAPASNPTKKAAKSRKSKATSAASASTALNPATNTAPCQSFMAPMPLAAVPSQNTMEMAPTSTGALDTTVEPFPGASSETFALLDNSALLKLGDWSWDEFAGSVGDNRSPPTSPLQHHSRLHLPQDSDMPEDEAETPFSWPSPGRVSGGLASRVTSPSMSSSPSSETPPMSSSSVSPSSHHTSPTPPLSSVLPTSLPNGWPTLLSECEAGFWRRT
ncbi:hypothetical protein C8J57DRAFT_492559 [Mycena rebaudengoi]|nr:hypothetical protein C8J57DRAFT_492559 [Mycena rebaudengoi]